MEHASDGYPSDPFSLALKSRDLAEEAELLYPEKLSLILDQLVKLKRLFIIVQEIVLSSQSIYELTHTLTCQIVFWVCLITLEISNLVKFAQKSSGLVKIVFYLTYVEILNLQNILSEEWVTFKKSDHVLLLV